MGRTPLIDATGELAPSVQAAALLHIRAAHREIARRVALGQSQTDIAKDLGYSESRMSIICNSPIMKQEIERLASMRDLSTVDVTIQMREKAPMMADVLEEVALFGAKDKDRVEAAKSMLSFAGYDPVKKVEGTLVSETHEQRLARLKRSEPRQINVVPTGVQTLNISEEIEKSVEELLIEEDAREGQFSLF